MILYAVFGGADCAEYTYLDSVWEHREDADKRVREIDANAHPGACEEGGIMAVRLNDSSELPEWVEKDAGRG